jgi:hypothetical protein
MDSEYAKQSPFGGRVAPASFVAAAAMGLGSVDVPTPASAGLVGMTWRFLRPLRPGDTIATRWRLARKRAVENPEFGLAVWQVEVVDSGGDIAAEGEVARLVSRREAMAPVAAGRPPRGGRARVRAPEPVHLGGAPGEPEPAPADTPPPARRRRRRSGGGGAQARPPETVPVGADAAGAAGEAPSTSPAPAPSRRRRRRRSSNGGRPPGPEATAPGVEQNPDQAGGSVPPADNAAGGGYQLGQPRDDSGSSGGNPPATGRPSLRRVLSRFRSDS